MSPGPSLAVVIRHTISNGRANGAASAISHAIGVGLWALLTIWGLAILVVEQPQLYRLITYAGAAYLVWLGIKALRSNSGARFDVEAKQTPMLEAVRDGFMIALLNPKLALFFIALFSQFVASAHTLPDRLIMIATAIVIDGGWYVLVAVIMSHSHLFEWLQRRAVIIDRITGVVLIGLALRVVTL